MSEQVKINPDLLIILVGSVINKCISEYKGDYKDCKASFPVNKFIQDLNNVTQEYTTKFPNIDIHFPQIDIKLLSFIITKTLYHKFVTVTPDHVIIDVLPHVYENFLKNIVATSTLRYAKYLLKSAKDLYELEQKNLNKEKAGVPVEGNAPKETIRASQQQQTLATSNEKGQVQVQVETQPKRILEAKSADDKLDMTKEAQVTSKVPEPTQVQPKAQTNNRKDSTVSEKPNKDASTSQVSTKENGNKEKVVDEDQTMEIAKHQKNEEPEQEESKVQSNADPDTMDIDEPQESVQDKILEKTERETDREEHDQEMSDKNEEENADVEEPSKTVGSKIEQLEASKVEENGNEVEVQSEESKQDETVSEEKQDEKTEKLVENIEENDEKAIATTEDVEEESLITKEPEPEGKDEDKEIEISEQGESDKEVERPEKIEEDNEKEDAQKPPSSPEEESPSIEEIPLKNELEAEVEVVLASNSSKETTPEVKQPSKSNDDENPQESTKKPHHEEASPPPSSSSSRKRARSRSPLPASTQQYKRFQNIAINLLNSIQEHRFSSPFLQPVNVKDAPDYYNVVSEPRDLKNIMKAVKSKNEPPLYQSVKELERDIMLMFANCIMYNQSGDDLVELTKTMKQDISELFKMFEEAEEDIK